MSDLEIIIPTYNRYGYVSKLLEHCKSTFNGISARLTVMDASLDGSSNDLFKLSKNIGAKYTYLPNTKMSERVSFAAQESKSPLLCFLGDDDIPQSGGYGESIRFLLSNPDYTVCHGNYISFNDIQKLYGHNYMGPSLENDNPLVRMFRHIYNYTAPNTFAVHRADAFKAAYQESVDSGCEYVEPVDNMKTKFTPDGYHFIYEFITSTIPIMMGKMKRLDVMFCYRRHERDLGLNYFLYCTDPKFSQALQCLKKSLEKFCPPHLLPHFDTTFSLCAGAHFGGCLSREEAVGRFGLLSIGHGFVPDHLPQVVNNADGDVAVVGKR